MLRLIVVLSALAATAVGLAPLASSQEAPVLHAIVGPDPVIYMTDAAGNIVRQVDPGTYTIQVDDRSEEHNFRLQGPGVNLASEVTRIEKLTWTVTLTEARYAFRCDPHAATMRGTLTVGNPPAPPPPPRPVRLVATVGAAGVTLRTAAGHRLHGLKAGRYSILVRDRSRKHNFHLRGRGVNRKTGVPFRGNVTWSLRLAKGRYTYGSDAAKRRIGFAVS